MVCDWNVFIFDKSFIISHRHNAFDISYNFLEQNTIIQKVESLSSHFSTENQIKKNASVDFLIHVLTNDPKGPSILGNLHLK